MAGLIICCIFGLFYVYQAFLVKRNPEKVYSFQKVKNEQRGIQYESGMQRVYFFNFLINGVLWIVTGLLSYFLGMKLTYMYMMFLLCVLGSFCVLIVKWWFTGDVPKWNWLLIAAAFILILYFYIWLIKGNKVEVLPEAFAVEGVYGTEMPYQDIDSAFVVNALPAVKYCKDGYSIFGNKKGEFRLKDGSEAKFYVLNKKAPFLELYTQDGRCFVNRKTAAETEQLIEELKLKMGDKIINL